GFVASRPDGAQREARPVTQSHGVGGPDRRVDLHRPGVPRPAGLHLWADRLLGLRQPVRVGHDRPVRRGGRPAVRRARQLPGAVPERRLLAVGPEHRLVHARCRPGPDRLRTAAGAARQPQAPRDLLLPDRLLLPLDQLVGRHRRHLPLALFRERPDQQRPARYRHRPAAARVAGQPQRRLRTARRPVRCRRRQRLAGGAEHRPALDHAAERLEHARFPDGRLPRRSAERAQRGLRGGIARRRLALAAVPRHHDPAAPPDHLLRRHDRHDRLLPGLRPDLHHVVRRPGRHHDDPRLLRLHPGLRRAPPGLRLGRRDGAVRRHPRRLLPPAPRHRWGRDQV
ncbi:MAG: ABC transporter, permease protein 1 (cluster 1, maltose/g3p/polyamine/iron), partial [uncultured Thermomicrobiales bacterium]